VSGKFEDEITSVPELPEETRALYRDVKAVIAGHPVNATLDVLLNLAARVAISADCDDKLVPMLAKTIKIFRANKDDNAN
jgi:hypothetical protein